MEIDQELDLPQLDKMEEEEANTHITNAILKAAKSSIPRGSVKSYTPFWNEEIQKSVSARQTARKEYEKLHL